jgi:ethanolamine ammonia-lyase small subunit
MTEDAWTPLRQVTSARIALGRSGGSLPTGRRLEFQLAHARARDAVLQHFDEEKFAARLANGVAAGHEVIPVRSAAKNRMEYLLRPDLGRRLLGESREKLAGHPDARAAERGAGVDVLLLLSDGLSTKAADIQIEPLLGTLLPLIKRSGWKLAPLVVARHGRVALQDEVGSLFKANVALMLLGERPGLLTADSLGAYFTYAPEVGKNDANRNCVSNIHAGGIPPAAAAEKLHYLLGQALRLQLSGVGLKDESGPSLGPGAGEVARLTGVA